MCSWSCKDYRGGDGSLAEGLSLPRLHRVDQQQRLQQFQEVRSVVPVSISFHWDSIYGSLFAEGPPNGQLAFLSCDRSVTRTQSVAAYLGTIECAT